MIDIVGELDGIEYFKSAGVNENGGNDKIDNSPKDNPFARYERNYYGCRQDRREHRPEDWPKRFHFFCRFNVLTIQRFNDSFSPRLPSRRRARIHQEAALPSAIDRLLRGPDRSFAHCNKQSPFFQATTLPKTVVTIRSSDLRSTNSLQARDHEQTRHPGEHRSRQCCHPTRAPDRRSPFPKAGLRIAMRSCRENKSLALYQEEARTLQE